MRLFAFIIVSVFVCSCNKAVLKNASVDVTKPPVIYGNNRALEAGTHNSISAEFTTSSNDITTPIHGYVKSEEGHPEFLADYRLMDKTWGLQFNVVNKKENGLYTGVGIGAQSFPYVFLNIGLNKKHFEFGSAVLLGYPSLIMDYEGDYENENGEKTGSFNRTESFGSINAYLYASVYYFERFALNYVISYTPQSNNYSLGDQCLFGGCDIVAKIYLNTPDLFIQDIGIVYINNHIKYRIGLSQIRSYELPKHYWGTSFQVAWLWG